MTADISVASSFESVSPMRTEIALFAIRISGVLQKYITWAISYSHNIFDKLLIATDGSLVVIDNYNSDTALRELKAVKNAINFTRKIVSRLERINFFDDAALKEKCNLTLDKMSELEGVLRLKAFNGKEKKKNNSDFINALTQKSKDAIITALEN